MGRPNTTPPQFSYQVFSFQMHISLTAAAAIIIPMYGVEFFFLPEFDTPVDWLIYDTCQNFLKIIFL